MGSEVYGFLKTEGQKIINENGQEVFLRGVGLGNWMLPEGYMWKFVNGFDRPRRIEQAIANLIGEEEAKHFWEKFYDRYTTEADIQKMSEEGFNSVRLPINSRFILDEDTFDGYIEEHLQIIDRFIDWCQKYKLYVFLDLHGAPGGQTGANIDDSKNNHPDLFRLEENKKKTIELWRMIADRYKDRWIVGGYDLLNEPIPVEFKEYNDQLVPLYKDITKAIREVDQKHIIILEGAHWATDFNMFHEIFDDNLVLQFHKYWNAPDIESIQRYIDKGNELNVPLWLGESGENSLDWFAGTFHLAEECNISWCFWPWKKLDTINTPCSINMPKNWNKVIDYLKGISIPDKNEAKAIFDEYLDNILLENCTYHPEVVNAMMRRIPLRIPAEFYGYKGEGISYGAFAKEQQNIIRKNDKIRNKFAEDNPDRSLEFRNYKAQPDSDIHNLCIELNAGEWTTYAMNCSQDANCSVLLRIAAEEENSHITLELDGNLILENFSISNFDWREKAILHSVLFKQGSHELKLYGAKGIVKLDWIEIIVE